MPLVQVEGQKDKHTGEPVRQSIFAMREETPALLLPAWSGRRMIERYVAQVPQWPCCAFQSSGYWLRAVRRRCYLIFLNSLL